MHHVMILGQWPTWRTIIFYIFIFIFNPLHVSSTSCSSSGETNFVNTSSGSCRWACRVQLGNSLPTCTRHGHQHRVTATTQFVSPDDEHDVLETCRKLKIKNKYIGRNLYGTFIYQEKFCMILWEKMCRKKVFQEANECATDLGCPVAKSVEQNTSYVDTQSTGDDIVSLLQ
jgi:hypothetical protein